MATDHQPGLVSLTTDFGLRDEYVGVLKAVLHRDCPGISIVDISHEIPRGEPAAADRLLGRAWPFFPQKAVHLVVVDPGVGTGRRLLVLEAKNHFFVGPDNGVFSHLLASPQTAAYQIKAREFLATPLSNTFHGRDIMAPVAARLAAGMAISKLADKISCSNCVTKGFPRVKTSTTGLVGAIVAIDAFGNACTNIHAKDLAIFAKEAELVIKTATVTIHGLMPCYQAAPDQALALFDSCQMVELALYNDSFASRYKAAIGDEVLIEEKL